MNNVKKKRTAPKRMRNLPSKSRSFRAVRRAAVAAGALTLTMMITACGESEGGTAESTKKPESTQASTNITTSAPVPDGTEESVRFEELAFETVYVENPEMYEGEEAVGEEGAAGKIKITEYYIYVWRTKKI